MATPFGEAPLRPVTLGIRSFAGVTGIAESGMPQRCEPPTALVAENDRWIRLVLHDLLAQAGYRVAEASNGFSALRIAEREPLALVLLDLVLPERAGLSVLTDLRASSATANLPVIVFSVQPRGLHEAVTEADTVIAGPFSTDALLAEVIRSGKRVPEGQQVVPGRRGRAGDMEPDCLRPLHLARESPGNGDGFSPACEQVSIGRES